MCCDIIGPSTMMRSHSTSPSREIPNFARGLFLFVHVSNSLDFIFPHYVWPDHRLLMYLVIWGKTLPRNASHTCRSASCSLFHSWSIPWPTHNLTHHRRTRWEINLENRLSCSPTQKRPAETSAGDATIISYWDFIKIRNSNIWVYWNTIAVKRE